MARIRTIKPSFFTSLTIADLSLTARLTFIGLWTHVDDDGRCTWDPRLIKAAIWPLDDRPLSAITQDVQSLTESSLITHYVVSERSFLAVNGWREHQRINRRTPSTLPGPESGRICPVTCGNEPSLRTHGGLTEGSLGEGKGREGNREGRTTSSNGSAVGPATDLAAEDFADFWDAYPRKEGKIKAESAFRSALRRASAEQIIDGARRYRDDPNREQAYTAHATTWLNRGGWDDAPLPSRGGRPVDRQADILRAEMDRARQADGALDLYPQIGA